MHLDLLAVIPGGGRCCSYYTCCHSAQLQTHRDRSSGMAAVASARALRPVALGSRESPPDAGASTVTGLTLKLGRSCGFKKVCFYFKTCASDKRGIGPVTKMYIALFKSILVARLFFSFPYHLSILVNTFKLKNEFPSPRRPNS